MERLVVFVGTELGDVVGAGCIVLVVMGVVNIDGAGLGGPVDKGLGVVLFAPGVAYSLAQ